MTNLTLAIDETLLQRAREAALRENTSVNALVRDFLGRCGEARSRRIEAFDQLRWSGFSGQPPSLTSEAGHHP